MEYSSHKGSSSTLKNEGSGSLEDLSFLLRDVSSRGLDDEEGSYFSMISE